MPIKLRGDFHLGLDGIGGRYGFENIICGAEGVLGNVRRGHRLAGGTRRKISGAIFFRLAGGRVGRERRLADSNHPEHARANPCSAGFYGLAGPVVLRAGLLKNWQDPFGAVRGPDGQ